VHTGLIRTGFGRSVAAQLGVVALALLALGGGNVSAQQADPAVPPPPCGPAATLPAELSRNVAPDSRCFELRMYTVDPARDGVDQFKGGINELHQRFREKEVEIFKKHGAEIVAVWQSLDNPLTLVWMLAYRDRAHREEVWAAFGADPEWTELRQKYFVPIERPNVTMLSATDYSPLK
jgi:NIPSNAP